MSLTARLLLIAFCVAASNAIAATERSPGGDLPERIAPTGYLLLPRVGDYRRAALHVDPVEAAIARGDFTAPKAGDTVRGADGTEERWRPESEPPPPKQLSGGYAYVEFESPADGVMLLEADGCAACLLNGEWVVGDPYGVGWFRPPVEVQRGTNRLLLHLARHSARARLVRPPADVFLIADQATLPDRVAGEATTLHGSLPLVNASAEAIEDLEIVVEGGEPIPLPWLAPRVITTATFPLPADPAAEPGRRSLRVIVRPAKAADAGAEAIALPPIATAELTLRTVAAGEPHVRTHVSAIDASVQPYSVVPAFGGSEGEPPGVLLVLHDAGADHRAAAARCEPLRDFHVVAPGGRGRFGFDWEDWSATDALEALSDFQRRAGSDASRVVVTGRGMGGHGALRLATLAPERFAAVAPSGAWMSFYTQGRAAARPADATPLETALSLRAAAADPLRLLENLRPIGVHVSHGSADVGVDVEESRLLRRRLGEFHPNFAYREGASAGAITDDSPLVRFCREQTRAADEAPDAITFATPDLGSLNAVVWTRIDAQRRQGDLSRVDVRRDRVRRRISGTTANVARLTFDVDAFSPGEAITVRLDGERAVRVRWQRGGGSVRLARDAQGVWRRVRDAPNPAFTKRPSRPGGFKSVFDRRPLLVFGARGDAVERRWAEAKARYDAMLFLYRGAGRLELVPEERFRPREDLDRNVVLYGASHTNLAARLLLRSSPVRIDDGVVDAGPRPEQGEDLALLLVRPRPGASESSIAVVGGSGPVGMRLTSRLRYFWSGVAYPDFLLFGPGAIDADDGTAGGDGVFRGDVRAVGDFGHDWMLGSGDVVWRDLAL